MIQGKIQCAFFKIDVFDLSRGYMWSDGSLPLKDGAFPSPCSVWLSFFKNIDLFILFWLPWVCVAGHRLSLVAAGRGSSRLCCSGSSLRCLLFRSLGCRRAGSVVVLHGLSCSTACVIFPDEGSNPCHLHWPVDSYPLCHQASPCMPFYWAAIHLGKPCGFIDSLVHYSPIHSLKRGNS